MSRKQPEESSSGGGIMVLYVSLMILLLAFFILLNAMSKTEEAKVQAVYQSLVGSFGFKATGIDPMGSGVTDTGSGITSAINPVEQDYNFMRGLVRRDKLQKEVRLMRSGALHSVQVSNLLLFGTDSLKLTLEGEEFLTQVAALVKDRSYPLSVYGHTDDAASVTTGVNNFDLSARRALVVLRYMTGLGVAPGRLAAFGLADTRPLMPNTSRHNRQTNNRIELVFDARDQSRHRLPDAPGKQEIDFRGFTFELPEAKPER